MDIDIVKILQEYVGEDVKVNEDSDVVVDLGFSSYDVAMILSETESKYPDITIDINEAHNIKKVKDIKKCLTKKSV